MILKRLKLSNIRSYKEEEINFPDGIVLLSGDIGAGKSTILLAIEFALFGMSKKGLTGDLLLRHGKHEGSVELHFALKFGKDTKEIIIKRNIRRSNQIKQESGFIIVDGVKTECTPVELKTRVLELLGYPQDMVTKSTDIIYRYTVYTPQEQMKQILFEDSNTRLETLRRVFDIDKYKRISHNMEVVLKEMKLKRSELSGKASDIEEKRKLREEKLKTKLDINRSVEELQPLISKYEEEMNKRRADLGKIENLIKENEKYRQEVAVLRIKHSTLQSNISESQKMVVQFNELVAELNKEIEQIKLCKPSELDKTQLEQEIVADEKQLEEHMAKKLQLEKEKEFNLRKINEISGEIQGKHDLTNEIIKKKGEVSCLEKDTLQIKEFETNIENLRKFINDLDMKIKEGQIHISASLKLKRDIMSIDKCPTCCQDIKPDHKDSITFAEDKKIREINLNINEIESEKKESVKEIEDKISIYTNLKEGERKLDKIKADLKIAESSQAELEKKRTILQELIRVKDKMDIEAASFDMKNPLILKENIKLKKEALGKLNIYEEQLRHRSLLEKNLNEKLGLIKELSEKNELLTKHMSRLTEDIAGHEVKLKDVEEIETKSVNMRKEIEELTKLHRTSELEMARITKQLEGVDEHILLFDKEISDKEDAQKKIAELSRFLSWSDEFFQPLMSTIEKHIMMKLYHEFNELFIKWFDTLMEDENLSAKLDDMFTPVIIQNGYETNVENLSGGERSAVALAYRLALNKVINSFITSINTKDIIILDEPTDGFSQEQLDKIKDVLDELDIRQVLLVSHETKIESFASHIIRIAKTEHVSCVM
jgi:exonuclease SbcC